MSISGTGVRTLRMGNGTWTFGNANGTVITAGTVNNLTLTAGTSTIVMNNTNSTSTVTFNSGTGLTWGKLTVNGNSLQGILNIVGGATTFSNVVFNAPNYIDYAGAGTHTITTLTAIGTSTNIISFNFPQWSMASGAVSAGYNWIRGGVCGGGASFVFASSFNAGQNAGCTVTAPSAGGGACILGGWLLWRDMPGHLNDNYPAWLEKAA